MAGTITCGTLSDGTNSTSSTNCIKGSAKAWVNFNGNTSAAIRSSYNVSSVTRNGTGDYTVTFTNALADANYTAIPMGTGITVVRVPYTSTSLAGSYRFTLVNGSGSVGDADYVNVACFR